MVQEKKRQSDGDDGGGDGDGGSDVKTTPSEVEVAVRRHCAKLVLVHRLLGATKNGKKFRVRICCLFVCSFVVVFPKKTYA